MLRLHPEIPLPADTPERMVTIFQANRASASPQLKSVLDGLIEKWSGWHGDTFRFLHSDGYGCGVKVENWKELHRRCIFV